MTAPTPEQYEVLSVEGLRAKLRYRRHRLVIAELIGRPEHTARCRERVESLELKLSALGAQR